jgi:uncharacterized protein
VIFVDSNIPMYLIGSSDAHRAETREMLERVVAAGEKLVTDAEVLQEILHRYGSIRRLDAIQPAFETLLAIVDEVWNVELADVQRAREIMTGHQELSARDAIHIAVMERNSVTQILSFDRGFDHYPGIRRSPGR